MLPLNHASGMLVTVVFAPDKRIPVEKRLNSVMGNEINIAEGHERSGFRPADYAKISILGFALAALANCFHTIILPLRVLDFVPEAQKSTYLGLLTFAGLVVAMAVQPIVGAISDRSSFRWGRRRPFILVGTIAAVILLFGTGYAASYLAIFVLWVLLQASSNTAQGPFQAFIPDLVPEGRRGVASGVKVLLEVLGGVALLRAIGGFMDRRIPGESDYWLLLSLGTLAGILLVTMLATVLTVKERPGVKGTYSPLLSSVYRSYRINVRANSAFIYFLISRLLFVMALTTVQTFGLFFFTDIVGVANPAASTANVFVVIGICMLVSVYPAGRLSDKIGRRPILFFSGGLGAAGILVLFFLHTYGYVMFGSGLVGIAAGAFMSTSWALATDLVPAGEEARYLGLTNLATAGGAALARAVGPGIDYFNALSAGMGYSFMLLACVAYFIAGTALLVKVKKTS